MGQTGLPLTFVRAATFLCGDRVALELYPVAESLRRGKLARHSLSRGLQRFRVVIVSDSCCGRKSSSRRTNSLLTFMLAATCSSSLCVKLFSAYVESGSIHRGELAHYSLLCGLQCFHALIVSGSGVSAAAESIHRSSWLTI